MSTKSVVLVCGGRDYANEALVFRILDELHKDRPISRLVHGDANGADRLAKKWAITRGVLQVAYPADWKAFGLGAGPKRNQEMLTKEMPHLVVAFPGGKGTADMVKRAEKSGVNVFEVEDNEHERAVQDVWTLVASLKTEHDHETDVIRALREEHGSLGIALQIEQGEGRKMRSVLFGIVNTLRAEIERLEKGAPALGRRG